MNEVWFRLLVGAGAALLRIGYGWATAPSGEAWSWLKFVRTIVAAVISGGLIAVYHEGDLWVTALQIFLGTIALDEIGKAAPKVLRLPIGG